MGQRELRASFQKVYGTPTNSYNNNWLRRKLYEGMKKQKFTPEFNLRRYVYINQPLTMLFAPVSMQRWAFPARRFQQAELEATTTLAVIRQGTSDAAACLLSLKRLML